jgi:geranylgeranyl diphosphate synthase type I
VYDEILGIWGDSSLTGKSSASDIETRKKSLPVVYGLERSEPLRRAYAALEKDGGGAVAEIVHDLEATGAREYAEGEARRLSEAALAHLQAAEPEPDAGAALHELTLDLLHRRR